MTGTHRRLSVINIDISSLSLISFIDQKSAKVFGDSPPFSSTPTLSRISVPQGGHSLLLSIALLSVMPLARHFS